MISRFSQNLDVNNVLKEYPRPQLERDSYINLNGLWQYSIVKKSDDTPEIKGYQGDILVPFSPESDLSGVKRLVMPDDVIYYKRTFTIDESFKKDKVFINFGAVDYSCQVFINDVEVGSHKGGYFPFTIDITNAVKIGENIIRVIVTDPSDTCVQAKGKQRLKHGGIWYTPQSGIWQTVWIESVNSTFIKSLVIIPDIDKGSVNIKVNIEGRKTSSNIEIVDNGKTIAKGKLDDNNEIVLPITDFKLWSPETPYLYDLKIKVDKDVVKSYFGMRKFSVGKDKKGIMRLFLNNNPYFHNGVLDQGYYGDGMLTPPSDAAMINDIKVMKDMGFNMLRKHIKLEPLRWYYHCDKMGILVWQDMVNGGGKYDLMVIGALPFINIMLKDNKYGAFKRKDEQGRAEYYENMKDTVNTLINVVSIAMWVPFNEGWGQFDADKAAEMVYSMDKTRTIDRYSGWHDQGKGDFKSMHIYFKKIKMPKDDRVLILSEFGGYSIKTEGHIFNPNKTFGYKVFNDTKSFTDAYVKLFDEQVIPNISKGLSATVYTQVTDVEEEINGFITYDREVVKIDTNTVKAVNDKIKIED